MNNNLQACLNHLLPTNSNATTKRFSPKGQMINEESHDDANMFDEPPLSDKEELVSEKKEARSQKKLASPKIIS